MRSLRYPIRHDAVDSDYSQQESDSREQCQQQSIKALRSDRICHSLFHGSHVIDRLLRIQVLHLTPNRSDEALRRDPGTYRQSQSRGRKLVRRSKDDGNRLAIQSDVADVAYNSDDGELLLRQIR